MNMHVYVSLAVAKQDRSSYVPSQVVPLLSTLLHLKERLCNLIHSFRERQIKVRKETDRYARN
jgi:hypothetical protein